VLNKIMMHNTNVRNGRFAWLAKGLFLKLVLI
jgi:hypothetical protein